MTERKLLTSENIGAVNRYYYDANGNRVRKTTGSYNTTISHFNLSSAYPTRLGIYGQDENSGYTTERYTYDAFNQLTKVTSNGTTHAEYTYLPNGLRHSKTVNGNKKYFAWDGDQIAAELNANNAVTSRYIYGTERICNTSNNIYYMYNNHGDVSDLTDANGNVTKTYGFFASDAFGDEKNPDSADTNPFRYCGEYYDTETGNIYLRARYYDPGVGAFINEDPIRDGFNWFSYCGGNPVNLKDMFGLSDYILATDDFKKQAEYKKKELQKNGRDVEDVIVVNSRSDFEEQWEKLDNDEQIVDDVYIYCHSNGVSLIFVEGSSKEAISINGKNSSGENIGNLNDLKPIDIDNLYLYACNAGNVTEYTYGSGNVASVLSKKLKNTTVYAYDGSIAFGVPKISNYTSIFGYRDRMSSEQMRFYEILDMYDEVSSTTTKPIGWVYYFNGFRISYPNTQINSLKE